MKYAFIASILCLGTVKGESGLEYDVDVAEGRSRMLLRREDGDVCTQAFSCYNCTVAQVCRPAADGSWSLVRRLPCPEDSPYCNALSGTCARTPDDDCGTSDDFICLADGRFPDPLSCDKYHVCKDLNSETFQCVTGYNYSPDSERCSLDSPCNLPNCTDKTGHKAAFEYSHYFAYCVNGSPLMVARCSNEYKLNRTSQGCDAVCEHDGPMADNEDCTKFFMCSTLIVSPTLSFPVRDRLSCPSGQAFHPTYLMCVDMDHTSCLPPTPTTYPPTPTTYPPTTTATTRTTTPISSTSTTPPRSTSATPPSSTSATPPSSTTSTTSSII